MENKKSILKKTLAVSLAAAMLCSTAAFAEAVGFVGANIGSITASAAEGDIQETPASSFEYKENDEGGRLFPRKCG